MRTPLARYVVKLSREPVWACQFLGLETNEVDPIMEVYTPTDHRICLICKAEYGAHGIVENIGKMNNKITMHVGDWLILYRNGLLYVDGDNRFNIKYCEEG